MSRNKQTTLIVNDLLKILAFGGMVSTIVITPGGVILWAKALDFLNRRERKIKAKNTLSYMKRSDLVTYNKMSDGKFSVSITKKGLKRAQKLRFDDLQVKKPKKWDKKWRLVMFDIPEKKRYRRSNLSNKLRSMGFYQLQKSAWVHAWPCSFEVELIKQTLGILDSHIVFAEISSIDHQDKLLKHFKIHE